MPTDRQMAQAAHQDFVSMGQRSGAWSTDVQVAAMLQKEFPSNHHVSVIHSTSYNGRDNQSFTPEDIRNISSAIESGVQYVVIPQNTGDHWYPSIVYAEDDILKVAELRTTTQGARCGEDMVIQAALFCKNREAYIQRNKPFISSPDELNDKEKSEPSLPDITQLMRLLQSILNGPLNEYLKEDVCYIIYTYIVNVFDQYINDPKSLSDQRTQLLEQSKEIYKNLQSLQNAKISPSILEKYQKGNQTDIRNYQIQELKKVLANFDNSTASNPVMQLVAELLNSESDLLECEDERTELDILLDKCAKLLGITGNLIPPHYDLYKIIHDEVNQIRKHLLLRICCITLEIRSYGFDKEKEWMPKFIEFNRSFALSEFCSQDQLEELKQVIIKLNMAKANDSIKAIVTKLLASEYENTNFYAEELKAMQALKALIPTDQRPIGLFEQSAKLLINSDILGKINSFLLFTTKKEKIKWMEENVPKIVCDTIKYIHGFEEVNDKEPYFPPLLVVWCIHELISFIERFTRLENKWNKEKSCGIMLPPAAPALSSARVLKETDSQIRLPQSGHDKEELPTHRIQPLASILWLYDIPGHLTAWLTNEQRQLYSRILPLNQLTLNDFQELAETFYLKYQKTGKSYKMITPCYDNLPTTNASSSQVRMSGEKRKIESTQEDRAPIIGPIEGPSLVLLPCLGQETNYSALKKLGRPGVSHFSLSHSQSCSH